MRIGFIGAGVMAQTFGRHLLGAGHEIVVSNSRGPPTLAEIIGRLGDGASAGTKQEAVDCDVTILATNWVSVPEALSGIDCRILVDGTNAHKDAKPDLSLDGVTRSIAALGGRTSSEIVAGMAPGAKVVNPSATCRWHGSRIFRLRSPKPSFSRLETMPRQKDRDRTHRKRRVCDDRSRTSLERIDASSGRSSFRRRMQFIGRMRRD